MDRAEKFWDKVAKSEAKQLDRFDDDYKRTLAAIEQHLTAEQKVLDFACGSGKVALAIADKVDHVTGIDLSSGMVGICEKRAKAQGLTNTTFLHGTIEDERLKPQSFDLIIACNILHLLDEPQPVIAHIAKLLKPGGLFIASTGVLGEKRGILTGLLWCLSKVKILPNMHFYKSEQLKTMVGKEFTLLDSTEWTGTFKDLLLVGKK